MNVLRGLGDWWASQEGDGAAVSVRGTPPS